MAGGSWQILSTGPDLPMDDDRKLRGSTTPPPIYPPPPMMKPPTDGSGNFKLRKRTATDIEEAMLYMGLSYEEATIMNSQEIMKFMTIRNRMEVSRQNIRNCMKMEGVTSMELTEVVNMERANHFLLDNDPIYTEGEDEIARLHLEEKKEAARVKIRHCIANVYTTSVDLEELFHFEQQEAELDDDDPAAEEATAQIARLKAWEALKAFLAVVSEEDYVAKKTTRGCIMELEQVLKDEQLAGKLDNNDPHLKEVRDKIAQMTARLKDAQKVIRKCIKDKKTSSWVLADVLIKQQIAGQLEDIDPAVQEARIRKQELVDQEEKAANAAREAILAAIAKLKTSVPLKKVLAQEKLAGNLAEKDPVVLEAKARIKELMKAEG